MRGSEALRFCGRVARGRFLRLAGCLHFNFEMSQRNIVAGALRTNGGA